MESDSSSCANNDFRKDCNDKLVIFEVDGFFGGLTLVNGEVSCRKFWLMDDVDNGPPESLVEGIVSLGKNARKFIKQLNESELPFIELFFGSENLLIGFLEF